jgi:hypothetical protein
MVTNMRLDAELFNGCLQTAGPRGALLAAVVGGKVSEGDLLNFIYVNLSLPNGGYVLFMQV